MQKAHALLVNMCCSKMSLLKFPIHSIFFESNDRVFVAKGQGLAISNVSLTPSYSSFNPLIPKSDQHQFSPNNISRSSRVLGYGNY